MSLPQKLILFRFLLAPIILSLAYFVGLRSSLIIVILMYLGLFSDIFDGIIARKQNISSASLRRLDSQTDMIFWVSIGVASWILHPDLIHNNRIVILIILAMEVSAYVISFIKFGKETCTHAFLSKIWGISLLIAFTFLIGFEHPGIPFTVAVVIGLISHIDRIFITLLLPEWTHDIPSAYHAFLIRKGRSIKRNSLLNG